MALLHSPNRAAWCGLALIATIALAGCSTTVDSAPSTATTPSAVTTPSAAAPSEDAGDGPSDTSDYIALCEANDAAAAAKAGTVGEDLAAVKVQAETIRSMLPLQGVSAEVAAGAEVFATAADEDVAILAQFPADSLVSDVGLDPKFTESDALNNALTDPDYQAFLVWVIQTCGLAAGDD